MLKKVIKRNGEIVDFNSKKIYSAILRAMKNGSGIVNTIIAENISTLAELNVNDPATIEEIEKYIYEELISHGEKLTAYAYKNYKEVRADRRNTNALEDSVLGLINCTNEEVMTENANKVATLVSTQRDLMAGEVSKHILFNYQLPANIVVAHQSGIIKYHDADYGIQPITNCGLVPLDDLFANGTVINKMKIETPKSLSTAMTLASQVAQIVASCQYGGQTHSISHLAPYVSVSKNKIVQQVKEEAQLVGINYSDDVVELIANQRLKIEIKNAVQTYNYQVNTMNTSNGQTPFITLFMYIGENKEYEEETALLAEEFLKQRLEGMTNEFGIKKTPLFPKILFVLDEDNMHKGSKYYHLKQLAVKCTAHRMNPDYISAKIMKEVYGHVFPCMGCRSFLFPFEYDGKTQFYGRGNIGVVTLNLPDVALSSGGNIDEFWAILDNRLENIVKPALEYRYNSLKNVKASVAPFLWQHGVYGRLNPDDSIMKSINGRGFSVSIGYTGLYETVKYLTGEDQTEGEGKKLALEIMCKLKEKADEWKETTGIGFSIYGTPSESSTHWFSRKLKERFGLVEGITDKDWVTNSYHIDITKEIDAFSKLSIEARLQKYSTGGAISYVEVPNMTKNLEALEIIIDHIYENNIYAEINTENDHCGKCGYDGAIGVDENMNWTCPQCGNTDLNSLSVIRRTCGYLGENVWNKGRKADILNRVKHI